MPQTQVIRDPDVMSGKKREQDHRKVDDDHHQDESGISRLSLRWSKEVPPSL